MDNLTEIKAQLDKYYQEYKANKNALNVGKTKSVAKLIVDIASSKDGGPSDVAAELARFSADVTNMFFESISKIKMFPLEDIDEILKKLFATNNDSKFAQYYVIKYAFATTSIIKYYKSEAYQSTMLPELVGFMAQFAIKSDNYKSRFYNLINSTMGELFKLEYSNLNRKSLISIWDAINAIYPDLSKATYNTYIIEWATKYGFFNEKKDNESVASENTIRIEEEIVTNSILTHDKVPSELNALGNNVISVNSGGACFNSSRETMLEKGKTEIDFEKKECNDLSSLNFQEELSSEDIAKKLYVCLKNDISKEQDAIITAFTDMITPIGKAFKSIQGEIDRSREFGMENIRLKAKNEDLEHQTHELRTKLQETNGALTAMNTRNEELKKRVELLELKNSELDIKLNEAYAINSRESSLEAEKIREELKQSFAFLYEDWLEYEFSDVSEENYESLQAIIKKIFRSLERNGIDFKGNN